MLLCTFCGSPKYAGKLHYVSGFTAPSRGEQIFLKILFLLSGKHLLTEDLSFTTKGTFSLLLLAVVDAQYCFRVIDVGGLREDQWSWDSYQLPADLPLPGANHRGPLRRNLMRPFPQAHPSKRASHLLSSVPGSADCWKCLWDVQACHWGFFPYSDYHISVCSKFSFTVFINTFIYLKVLQILLAGVTVIVRKEAGFGKKLILCGWSVLCRFWSNSLSISASLSLPSVCIWKHILWIYWNPSMELFVNIKSSANNTWIKDESDKQKYY